MKTDAASLARHSVSWWVFLLFFLAAGVSIFLNGVAVEGAEGVFLSFAGLVMLLFPPQTRVEGRLWILLAALLLFCALALLPQDLFAIPVWRAHLQGLPIPLGKQVTPVPSETAFFLCLLGISGCLCLFGLAHPLRSRCLLWLACAAVLVYLCYAGLAIYSWKTGWKYPFDEDASFGFFPNRNHTATFLITGSLLSSGLLAVAARSGRWLYGALASAGLCVCAVSLLIYSSSRGGVVFLLLAIFLWLLGMGRARWSIPLLVTFLTTLFAGSVLFYVSNSEARNRLVQPYFEKSDTSAGQDYSRKEVTSEGRLLIYKDTLRMISQHPIMGIGLGAFRYVYPFYQRDSLSESTSAHPESDWLMLAAEGGLPSLLVAIAAGVFLLRRIRGEKEHPYWPLRWSFVCAAGTAVLHGLVDVPIHRIALGWWILLIFTAGVQVFPKQEMQPRLWEKIIFALVGLGALGLGIFLIRAEWFGGTSSPPFRASRAAAKIYEIYQSDPEKASQFATGEIEKSPMDQGLYHQKALLQLRDEGTDHEVDSLFAARRALNPSWPQIPLDQGDAWIKIDTGRTATLWLEAIGRIRKIDQVRGSGRTLQLYDDILRKSAGHPEIQLRLREAFGRDPAMLLTWLERVEAPLAREEIKNIAADPALLATFPPASRKIFLRIWYDIADHSDLQAFAKQIGWQDAAWPIGIRQLLDARNFQEAVQNVVKHNHLDLSLPTAGTGKISGYPEEIESPLERFTFYWKSGNQVTARRVLEEARAQAEKSGKKSPEIWKTSASLAIHDEHWELAWSCLQRYVRESGLDASL